MVVNVYSQSKVVGKATMNLGWGGGGGAVG